jgi:hypothetical protein
MCMKVHACLDSMMISPIINCSDETHLI